MTTMIGMTTVTNCKHKTCPLVEVSLIPLSQGRVAIVDRINYDYLMQWKWCVTKGGGTFRTYYACRTESSRKISMHRQLLATPKGLQSDHINHNGLDNRRVNLRTCTVSANQQNQLPRLHGTSQHKGVSLHRKSWVARIACYGKHGYLGAFRTEIEAAKAYNNAAKVLFGKFAYLNSVS